MLVAIKSRIFDNLKPTKFKYVHGFRLGLHKNKIIEIVEFKEKELN